jgi:23S rRNA (uracil1939-C5)-methyltransferase
VTVERLGVRGDGIAAAGGRKLFLPFTAPGDRVLARLDGPRGDGVAGTVLELLAPSPERAAPACRHFGACGGCALQHLAPAAYAAAKLGRLREALARHGIPDVPLAAPRIVPPASRRRARLAVAGGRVGFQAARRHAIVDLAECAVLHPRLAALFPPLRELAPSLWRAGESGAVTLTLAESGVDALVDLPRTPDLGALETLAAFAEATELARLAWRDPAGGITPAAQRQPVRVLFAGVPVELPSDAFLQASAEADAWLAEAVLDGVGEASRIADLFAGVGTLSFPLAAAAAVHAVDGARPALAALAAAARRAGLAGRVTVEPRDLEARPLLADDLARFDAVVFDPPRAGAAAQAAELARSAVRRVVAVSCNPATFGRDARLLVDGGYRLVRVQPIDQFLWSPHLELVAHFERRG